MIEADGYRDTRRHLIDGHSVQQARDMYVCYDVSITSLLEATYHRELCWLLGFSRIAKARTVHEPWEMSHEPWEATSHEPLSHEKPWATNLEKPWATNLGKPRATSHELWVLSRESWEMSHEPCSIICYIHNSSLGPKMQEMKIEAEGCKDTGKHLIDGHSVQQARYTMRRFLF